MTEGEVIDDHGHFAPIVNEYRGMGLQVAIDDFGAGYSGLNLLADFQPDFIKLDMNLVRGIGSRGPRQAIVRAIAASRAGRETLSTLSESVAIHRVALSSARPRRDRHSPIPRS